MDNADTTVARRFVEATAHSPESVRASGHTLAWDVKPFPFKVYVDAPAVALAREGAPLGRRTMDALAAAAAPADRLTPRGLTALLYYSAGVTKKKSYPGGGEVLFRAAASTGALYQTEVYVVAGAVDGLAAGVYHFCPGDFVLRELRAGDWRGTLAEAAADPALARRAATLVLTAIFWRNTWKYQARGWRHLYWDSGTMLANAVAVGDALGLAPRVLAGFVDAQVDRLLALDPDREATLELLPLGPEGPAAPPGGRLDAIAPEVMPLSSAEVDYPALREMQRASALPDAASVRAWRAAAVAPPAPPAGEAQALPPPPDGGRARDETIQRRGSTRRFAHVSLAASELAAALWAATRARAGDVPEGLVEPWLIVNAVESLEPGTYRYHAASHGLERGRRGDLRRLAAFLCLEQALAGDAAAVLFFLAPLDAVLATRGNRGYRLANLAAGVAGGRAYLAAYALGFGASGLTFYDRHVVDAFAPAAAGRHAIFVTALGRGAGARDGVLVSTTIQPPRGRT